MSRLVLHRQTSANFEVKNAIGDVMTVVVGHVRKSIVAKSSTEVTGKRNKSLANEDSRKRGWCLVCSLDICLPSMDVCQGCFCERSREHWNAGNDAYFFGHMESQIKRKYSDESKT